jgi:hypothetical protein
MRSSQAETVCIRARNEAESGSAPDSDRTTPDPSTSPPDPATSTLLLYVLTLDRLRAEFYTEEACGPDVEAGFSNRLHNEAAMEAEPAFEEESVRR